MASLAVYLDFRLSNEIGIDISFGGIRGGQSMGPLTWVMSLGGHIGSTAPGNFRSLPELPKAGKLLDLIGGKLDLVGERALALVEGKADFGGVSLSDLITAESGEESLLSLMDGFKAAFPRKNG